MLDRLDEETDANTRVNAIDAAVRHYLEEKENGEEHWERFPPEPLKLLNTSEMKVSYYPKVR
jgi:hypothetical protein